MCNNSNVLAGIVVINQGQIGGGATVLLFIATLGLGGILKFSLVSKLFLF